MQRADFSKCDHVALAAALNEVSQSLASVLTSTEEDIQEGLKASGLCNTPTWLLTVGDAFASSLKSKHSLLCKGLEGDKARADELISKMPPVDNEGNYREEALKQNLLRSLAEVAVALEKGQKELQSIASTQKKLSNLKFGEGKQLQFELDDASASGLVTASGTACAIAAFHVAAVSSLCILRSDDVVKSSQLPEKTVKYLKDALATLQNKLKKLPEDEATLKAFGNGVVDEMARVISKGSKSAGAEKSQEDAKLAEAKGKPASSKDKEEGKAPKEKKAKEVIKKDKSEKKKDKDKHKDKERKNKKDKKQKKKDEDDQEEDADMEEEDEEMDDEAESAELLDGDSEPEKPSSKTKPAKETKTTKAKPDPAAKGKAKPVPKTKATAKSKKTK